MTIFSDIALNYSRRRLWKNPMKNEFASNNSWWVEVLCAQKGGSSPNQ